MPICLARTLRDELARADRPLVGMWTCSGSPVAAEICAGSGLDLLLIETEHAPVGVERVQQLLQAAAAYPITPLVRIPEGETVAIKRALDTGAQNILVPMVSSAEHAREMASAMHYPPRGVRGVGSAFARSARWNRVPNYLAEASDHVSLTVQIETTAGVGNATEIAAVDGVDAVFIGPSDLSASMGLIGQQTHPDVVAAVKQTIRTVTDAGKPVGVNAFNPDAARDYLASGARFVFVGSDVTMLARGSQQLAEAFIPSA